MGLIEIMHAALDAGDMPTAALAIAAMPGAGKLPPEILRDLFRIGLLAEPTANDVRKVRTVAKDVEARNV